MEELSMFVLGRKSDADLGSDCDGQCGTTYCFCCPGYKLKILLYLIVFASYIGVSFVLGIVLKARIDDE